MIPQSFIQELLGRVDIVDVVDRHVKLKRAGSNYSACCPFHSEKSPSFTVSPTKQFYHCFGCGAHGTAIGFLMEYSGLSYPDAIRELAQSVGLKVPEVRSEAAERKAAAGSDLYGLLLKAAHYYRARLKDAPHAIRYLKGRGLSGEIAKAFGIGYAPDGWQNLADVFPDYAAHVLVTAGLVKQGDEGKRYDVFRNRIMFPIVDVRGNVIGFGGRVLGDDDGGPKYLNSPETPVFEKGRELYGLYQARRAIRDAGRVVVVEGYMDVVALAQNGVGYAVATLGTATTPVHVQKLLRQADEIVFCFDGDAAGRRAAWRALEVSLGHIPDGKQVKFLFLPETEDPDTFVRKSGKAAFESALNVAPPLSKFLLQELAARHDLSSAEGRAACIHQAKPLLKQMPEGALRAQLVRELAAATRSTPEETAKLCELKLPAPASGATAPRPALARAPAASLARQLLALLIANPGLAARVSAEHRALLDADPDFSAAGILIDLARTSGAETLPALLEAARGSEHAQTFEEVAGETMLAGAQDTAPFELEGAFNRLELKRVETEYAELAKSGVRSEAARQRFQAVSRRLAELKGASRPAAPGGA